MVAADGGGIWRECAGQTGVVAVIARPVRSGRGSLGALRRRYLDVVNAEGVTQAGIRLDAEEFFISLAHYRFVCAVVKVLLDESVSHYHQVKPLDAFLQSYNFAVPVVFGIVSQPFLPVLADCKIVTVSARKGEIGADADVGAVSLFLAVHYDPDYVSGNQIDIVVGHHHPGFEFVGLAITLQIQTQRFGQNCTFRSIGAVRSKLPADHVVEVETRAPDALQLDFDGTVKFHPGQTETHAGGLLCSRETY